MIATHLANDTLRIGSLSITFQRTFRIPDDGRTYPLPPGLGAFPLRRVDDYAGRVPSEWLAKGGVMLPMYRREAMWLSFGGHGWHAIKVNVGKVCALTGERYEPGLHARPQNYMVTPTQPWLDGICVGGGAIRQFVATPMGHGYTVEGQVTGEETVGGLQIEVHAMREEMRPKPRYSAVTIGSATPPPSCAPAGAPVAGGYRSLASVAKPAAAMGLGAGGRMKQKVHPDPYGLHYWEEPCERVFVHLVTAEAWRDITGEAPPTSPITAKSYASQGLPWFDVYDENVGTLEGTATLKEVKSVATLDVEKTGSTMHDESPVVPGPIKVLKHWADQAKRFVRDGDW